jgi:hypothetical protein
MSFPFVSARQTSVSSTTNATSFTPTLSTHATAELLVVVVSADGNPTLSTTSSGWTKLGQDSNSTVVTGAVFWKVAASASESLIVDSTATEQYSAISLTIRGGAGVTGSVINGSSTNSDPPNHAATNGTEDYLWIATRSGDSTTVATGAPTNYSNLQTIAGGGTNGVSTNTAERSLTASSENPGTFTSATEQWVSWTLAIAGRIPGTGSLTFSGIAPVLAGVVIAVTAGSLAFSGRAPATRFSGPTTGTLTLSGIPPSANLGSTPTVRSPGTGALTLAGQAPNAAVVGAGTVTPQKGALTLSGGLVGLRFLGPDAGSLTFTGVAPTLSTGISGHTVTPGSGSLAFTGTDVEVAFGGPETGTLTFTGQAPSLVRSGIFIPASASLTLSGIAPSLVGTGPKTPATGTLTITGQGPRLAFAVILPPAGSVTVSGVAPVSFMRGPFTPATAALTLSGGAPALGFALTALPPTGTLTISGVAPITVRFGVVTPSTGALTLTGRTPALAFPNQAFPATGALTLTGVAPTRLVSGSQIPQPGTAVLTLAGQVPTAPAITPRAVLTPTMVVEVELSGEGAGWTAITTDVIRPDGLSVRHGMTAGGPTDRVASAGSCQFSLNNSHRNSASLEGYYSLFHANTRAGWTVGIGCRVRFQDPATLLWHTRFVGRLDAIDPIPGKHRDRKVRVTATDWMDEAARWTLTSNIGEQIDKRADEILAAIVVEIPTDPVGISLDTGSERYPYALDSSDNTKQTALAEFKKLANSEQGLIYLWADGTLRFEGRHARLADTTTQWSLTDDDIVSLTVPTSRDDILNTVRVTTHPKIVDALPTTVVYDQANVLTMDPLSTRLLIGSYRDPLTGDAIGATDVQGLVAGVDYLANTAADGSGTDRTADIAITATIGASGVRFIVSSANASVIYLTRLQLRGRGIYDRASVQSEARDSASVDRIGEHVISLDMPYQDNPAIGQGAATYWLGKYTDALAQAQNVSVMGTSATRLTNILELDISDRIMITETITGVNNVFIINGEDLRVLPSGHLQATYVLSSGQEIHGGSYWILGMSVLGVNTFPAAF